MVGVDRESSRNPKTLWFYFEMVQNSQTNNFALNSPWPLKSYFLTQQDFWLGVGGIAHNTSMFINLFVACLKLTFMPMGVTPIF